ncbi:MAG: alpha-glucan family phosphorylase [Bacteroidales bacterium]
MTLKNIKSPDYLIEVSWEVCNKVGGINTVLATKVLNLSEEYKDKHILIGPDVWMSTNKNPEFNEDPLLFKTWKDSLQEETGIRVRVGRWNISGYPIAILVNFTSLFETKNDLLSKLWELFKLDSLNGTWDYVESLCFGYAAGQVIESLMENIISPENKVVAQFHEWMSGGGILYLKEHLVPVATVFTTHATVLGRSLSSNNIPLYSQLDYLDPIQKAKELNIAAKYSLEKLSAELCDIFTTVSDLTAKECEKLIGRKVDIVTPNGFENNFVPKGEEFDKIRNNTRLKLAQLANVMSGDDIESPVFVGIGGRYEYKNKGIDVFIDSLASINADKFNTRNILAFIMVPGGIKGPDKELVSKMNGANSSYTTNTTHYLTYPEGDEILRKLHQVGLENKASDKVKVFFMPSYLNGNDGVINITYYNLLMGLDLSVFPSYYEPWGYTPLESLAFKVPTITTTLAGFGLWVNDYFNAEHPSIKVIKRVDENYSEVVESVKNGILEIASLSPKEVEKYRNNAEKVSEIALWENNIEFYKQAYAAAVAKLEHNKSLNKLNNKPTIFKKMEINKPSWSRVIVSRNIPERLSKLEVLSKNIWWSWNQKARNLFYSIDPEKWEQSKHNPILLLDMLTLSEYKKLTENDMFLKDFDSVVEDFDKYMAEKANRKGAAISYFCMEYGLDTSLKIYSGGLGILAGDYLKESSDMNVNMTAFGFLYRYGYFTQHLSSKGAQEAQYDAQDFSKIPAVPVRDKDNKWVSISVAFPGRNINARLWKVEVGRTDLYLLDTDYEDNLPEDRQVSYHLYGGDWENRLKQELVLGIGGIRAMRALGIDADIYHCNEGHAAFVGLERLNEYINNDNLSFDEALELVRASSLFTTHTPVPAGHDAFSEDLLRKYISGFTDVLKIDWTRLMSLGKINPTDVNEQFSMSNLACSISQEINGVSWLHGKVSQDILSNLWPGYLPEENHVGYVTNGVHYPTWTAPEWKTIHSKVFGEEFNNHKYNKTCFEGIFKVADSTIWDTRKKLRHKLVETVLKRLSDQSIASHYSPREVIKIKERLRDDVLTIGFARRFATYKRAHLLFNDLDELDRTVNNPDRPVQFIFAGKAHPADKAGQDLITKIVEISKMDRFIGKIVFVPNYDINLAKKLVQGVDVWMNTPTRPLEASGTSGEKAAMNGVMHFSVLDGWWVEGYKKGCGWALPLERSYDNQSFQNELDSAMIYNILDNEIAPMFYDVDPKEELPLNWIQTIKNTVAYVACNFTTNRMLNDYILKFYLPLYKRVQALKADDNKIAKEIAFWKNKMRKAWNQIEVKSFIKPSDLQQELKVGKDCLSEVQLFLGDIDPKDIGVELLVTYEKEGRNVPKATYPFEFVEMKDGIALYRCHLLPNTTGVYQLSGRYFAKNDLLPHRQDFELVRWL